MAGPRRRDDLLANTPASPRPAMMLSQLLLAYPVAYEPVGSAAVVGAPNSHVTGRDLLRALRQWHERT